MGKLLDFFRKKKKQAVSEEAIHEPQQNEIAEEFEEKKEENSFDVVSADLAVETEELEDFTLPVIETQKEEEITVTFEKEAEEKQVTEEGKQVTEEEKIVVPKEKKGVQGKFEIHLKTDGYRFYLIANNGQLLYESTGYTSPSGAEAGIETFKKAVKSGSFIVDKDKFGRFRYFLNKRYAGENYTTKASCESSIESVKHFSLNSVVIPYEQDKEAEERYNEYKSQKTPIIDWNAVEEEEKQIKPSGKFEIVESEGGFRYYLLANNGQLLISSNTYASSASAKDGIKNFKKAVYLGKFYVDEDKFGRFRFILRGGNFSTVYIGESYTTRTACEKIINSVKKFTKSAVIS